MGQAATGSLCVWPCANIAVVLLDWFPSIWVSQPFNLTSEAPWPPWCRYGTSCSGPVTRGISSVSLSFVCRRIVWSPFLSLSLFFPFISYKLILISFFLYFLPYLFVVFSTINFPSSLFIFSSFLFFVLLIPKFLLPCIYFYIYLSLFFYFIIFLSFLIQFLLLSFLFPKFHIFCFHLCFPSYGLYLFPSFRTFFPIFLFFPVLLKRIPFNFPRHASKNMK